MRRIELPCVQPCFIGAWQLDKPQLCDEIIAFFERNPAMHSAGVTYGVNTSVKKSTDLSIEPRDLLKPTHAAIKAYFTELHQCYLDYQDQWPILAARFAKLDIGSFNIQKYDPGGHFAAVHCERDMMARAHRVMAWMTYLNDVEDGGQTNFAYYGLDVKPEKGKTLIWPAEWTHSHSGKVVNSGVKYIITGWMHFPVK